MQCVIKALLDVAEDMHDVRMSICKLLSCSLGSGVVMQHKFGALSWISIKQQAQASLFPSGFCLSVNHQFSSKMCFAFLSFFFLLHFHLYHCAAICFLGGEDPFLTTRGDDNDKFTLIENSFKQRKFA